MKKKKKKNRRFRIFLLFLFVLTIIAIIIFLLGAYVFDTKVKTIVVHNNSVLQDEEIIDMAFPNKKYPNIFLVNSLFASKKIEKSPLIKDADIKRNILFELHIYVKENKPLFVREDTNKVVLSDGKEIANDNYNFNIPSLINYVPDTKYKKLIVKMNSVNYDILKKISDIKYYPNKYDEDRFVLFMNDSNKVYINLPKFKSINKYDSMVEKFEGKKGILYLDSGNYFKVDK